MQSNQRGITRRNLLVGGGAAVAGIGGAAFVFRKKIKNKLDAWTTKGSFSATPPLVPHDPVKDKARIAFGQGGFAVNRPCPKCRGRGTIPSVPCPTCRGAGEVRTERKVMITVPQATESGTKVRLKGQGQPGSGGKPAGDLIVSFEVQPDRFFHRDGLEPELKRVERRLIGRSGRGRSSGLGGARVLGVTRDGIRVAGGRR